MRVPSEELRRLVVSLPGFVDDPEAANEAELEEIQSAWFDAAQES
jgi:FeS assembly protein IscX